MPPARAIEVVELAQADLAVCRVDKVALEAWIIWVLVAGTLHARN